MHLHGPKPVVSWCVHLWDVSAGGGEISVVHRSTCTDVPVSAFCLEESLWGVMDGELRLRLSEEGADTERLALLTGYLRSELLQLDVEDVSALPAGEPPPGARAFGVATVGALLIALGQSAESLRSVVSAVNGWLRRDESKGRTIRLELEGDSLELSQASEADQERLIELFIRKHTTEEAPS